MDAVLGDLREPADDGLDRPGVEVVPPDVDHIIGPAEDATVGSRLPNRLGLGPHVGGQEDAEEGERADRQMAVGRVERNPSEHHDVGIAVEHVVEEVASGGRLPGHPRDSSVEGVEV